MQRHDDRTTFLILTWFTFAFFVLLTLVRFLEGGSQCCGSPSSRKHDAHAQPQVVVVQQPPAGTYPAYPPPAGQFMTAAANTTA